MLVSEGIEEVAGVPSASDGGQIVRQGGAGAHPGLSRQPKGKAKRLYVGPQPRPFAGIARTFRPSELDEARGPEARSKARYDNRTILKDHRRHVVRQLSFGGMA